MTNPPLTHARILQIGLGFWPAKTLLSAVELGLFTQLAAAGPQELGPLRAALGLHGRSAQDFLDALVALGLLERDQAGRYSNGAEAAQFLDRAKPTYVGGLLEMANARLYGFWGHLTEALRTGEPQNEIRSAQPGDDLFAALYADPARLENFLRAMTGVSRPTAQAVAAQFDWSGAASFCDIGCAQGGLVAEIALAQPRLQAMGFDLPAVGPIFQAYMAERGVTARFLPGSFFTDPLPAADVLLMGHILHDWSLAEKRRLLEKAYVALPPGGRLLVYDMMIDDARRENVMGFMMSLNMLIETTEGFDYTAADCRGWMAEAGFRDLQTVRLPGPHTMVVGRK